MKHLFKKGNTIRGKSKFEKNCEFCDKPFMVHHYSIKKGQGRFCSRKCFGASIKGKKLSVETCIKISKIAKANGHGKWMLGKILSKEWVENIGKASTGRRHSIETRQKMSELHQGEKSYLWKGGLTQINQVIRNSFKYRLWRTAVFERDNYTCQECGTRSGNGKAVVLNADHIKAFSLFPKLRFELLNGRTLCVDCHRKTGTFGSNVYKLNAIQA